MAILNQHALVSYSYKLLPMHTACFGHDRHHAHSFTSLRSCVTYTLHATVWAYTVCVIGALSRPNHTDYAPLSSLVTKEVKEGTITLPAMSNALEELTNFVLIQLLLCERKGTLVASGMDYTEIEKSQRQVTAPGDMSLCISVILEPY